MQHQKIRHEKRQLCPPDREAAHPTDRHFGRRVALLRLELRLTQAQLAVGVGVSVQQIQKYESARNRISASMLHRIALFMGVPVSRLFDGLPGTDRAGDSNPLPANAHIAFLASRDGRDLIDSVLALPPRMRRRMAALIDALGQELSPSLPTVDETGAD
jgi:transcriptional regulator with XRE-family HTH domain